MPQFAPGQTKTAKAPIAVKPSGLNCSAEIFLGPDPATKETTSGLIPFTSTGASQEVSLPISMPVAEGPYHCYIDVYAEGMLVAAYKATEDISIAKPMPSSLLTSYQATLAEAYRARDELIAAEMEWQSAQLMVPNWGIQTLGAILNGGMVDPKTGALNGSLPDAMINEAISIGMIVSPNDCYFDQAVMYFNDGTTIVPYWWGCPYCSERFRSPALRDAHIESVHAPIINTRASMSISTEQRASGDPVFPGYGYYYSVIFVNWTNNSPWAITATVSLQGPDPYGRWVNLGSVTRTVAAGGSVSIDFGAGGSGDPGEYGDLKATLTLVDGAAPGKLLDTAEGSFQNPIPWWAEW